MKATDKTSRTVRRPPRHAAPVTRREPIVYAAFLVLIALLVPLHRWWAVQVLLVPVLFIIPGAILLRALRVPDQIIASFPVYVPCASIVVLLGSGLVVDLTGPLLGVREPIRPAPLLVCFELVCLALLAASIKAPPTVAIRWSPLAHPARLAWPLILPLVAAAGALRLNNGHGAAVAVASLFACAVLIAAAVVFCSRLSSVVLAMILYAAELATMWSFSLRGDLVYGFDIAIEYYDLHRTVSTGVWQTAHPGDAYGAMLSVTVMPAELHFLAGVPALMVFKLVYPAVSALLPVAVFGLARRVLSRRWAFVAAASIVMQASFAQELPAVARQQIALVLFSALAMAMLDRRHRGRSQLALVALFSLAMTVSHYSTTYVAILLAGLVLLLQFVAHWLRKIPRVTGAVAVAFIVSCAGAVIWYGPVTHSAAHLGQVAQTVSSDGLDLLPNRTIGEGAIASYLQGNVSTPIPAGQYARLVATEYASNDLFIIPLPSATSPAYALQNSAPPTTPVRSKAAHDAFSFGTLIIQQLVYLLSAAGALMMVLRRKVSLVTRHLGLLALATLLFLLVIRLSGTLAAAYNQERALLQAMMILAIPMCWSLQWLTGQRHRRQVTGLIAAAASLIILLITTSGLLGALLGGGTTTNLANSGEDFERFDMTSPELASAQWLGQSMRPGQLVYADRYAQLPLIAITGVSRGLFNDVTPATINQHAWIYADRSNVVDGRSRALFKGQDSVSYVFPAKYLDTYYDLVYTNGSSEVFRR